MVAASSYVTIMLLLSTVILSLSLTFFFFNDTATTEIYTLSLHDALPISMSPGPNTTASMPACESSAASVQKARSRSEEHTSELQSPDHLVCRLLLEKKNKNITAATQREAQSLKHAQANT